MRHIGLCHGALTGQLTVVYIGARDIGANETRRRAEESIRNWWDAIVHDRLCVESRQEIADLQIWSMPRVLASKQHSEAIDVYMRRRGALLRWIAETYGGLTDNELAEARAEAKQSHQP